MRWRFVACGAAVALLVAGGFVARPSSQSAPSGNGGYPVLTQEAWDRMFEEVSNWGRWGPDDQLGAVNLITPEKRKQAAALVKTGRSVSLEHQLIETADPDVHTPFQKFNHGNMEGRSTAMSMPCATSSTRARRTTDIRGKRSRTTTAATSWASTSGRTDS